MTHDLPHFLQDFTTKEDQKSNYIANIPVYYSCNKGCCNFSIMPYSDTTHGIHNMSGSEGQKRRRNERKAGVVIYDRNTNKLLLVQSRGHYWGFPKGTIKTLEKESEIDCAIREVYEETGLTLTKDDLSSGKGSKPFVVIKGNAYYYYYEMPECPTIPQVSNDHINDANGIGWFSIDCIKKALTISHGRNDGEGDTRYKGMPFSVNMHCRHILFNMF